MVLVNHFLDTNLSGILIPNRDAANVTNTVGSIMSQANICSSLYQRNANFILVSALVVSFRGYGAEPLTVYSWIGSVLAMQWSRRP